MKRNSVLILVSLFLQQSRMHGRKAMTEEGGRKKSDNDSAWKKEEEKKAPPKFPLQGGGKRMRGLFPFLTLTFLLTVFVWESRSR